MMTTTMMIMTNTLMFAFYLSFASIVVMLALLLLALARLCANSSNDAVAGVVGVSDDLLV